MAKKPATAQPGSVPTLATAGGSYLADEAAGAVRQEGPTETTRPSRRGFGCPQSAGEPVAAAPATLQE